MDFYSEKIIKKNKQNYYKKKDYIPVWIESSKFEIYDGVQFHYKSNDKKYKIVYIEGVIFYKNINDCYTKLNKIDEDLLSTFPNTDRADQGITKHPQDKTGKSIIKGIAYFFESDDVAFVDCYDWSKEMEYRDQLRIGIKTNEINKWIGTAY